MALSLFLGLLRPHKGFCALHTGTQTAHQRVQRAHALGMLKGERRSLPFQLGHPRDERRDLVAQALPSHKRGK